jgi:hypothetical protein
MALSAVTGSSYPVFLSITTPYTPMQEVFLTRVEEHMMRFGLVPKTLRRTEWSFEAPLIPIRRLMARCFGTIVVALVRSVVQKGVLKPGGSGESPIKSRYLATPWIQLEAAMAFQLGQPLFVLKEDVLFPEGILDPASSGLLVQPFSISDEGALLPDDFGSALAAFRQRVVRYAKQKKRGGGR